jgi:hypothetical protein
MGQPHGAAVHMGDDADEIPKILAQQAGEGAGMDRLGPRVSDWSR